MLCHLQHSHFSAGENEKKTTKAASCRAEENSVHETVFTTDSLWDLAGHTHIPQSRAASGCHSMNPFANYKPVATPQHSTGTMCGVFTECGSAGEIIEHHVDRLLDCFCSVSNNMEGHKVPNGPGFY